MKQINKSIILFFTTLYFVSCSPIDESSKSEKQDIVALNAIVDDVKANDFTDLNKMHPSTTHKENIEFKEISKKNVEKYYDYGKYKNNLNIESIDQSEKVKGFDDFVKNSKPIIYKENNIPMNDIGLRPSIYK